MAFSEKEYTALLSVKGVGKTVIQRLEEIGINSLASLAEEDVSMVVEQISAMLGATCWKNSPHAKAAISNAIDFAKKYIATYNV